MNLSHLSTPFPRAQTHWRAQVLNKEGSSALALAYIDARDVMDRLDNVCGPGNWQSVHNETARGRIVTKIGILVGDQWVWKSDGAGDTAVEGEKGGISDAFKRAAVHWGIGRYLYRFGNVWAPCKSVAGQGGKLRWHSWTADPWGSLKNAPQTPDQSAIEIFKLLKEGANPKEIKEKHGSALRLLEAVVPQQFNSHIQPYLEAA